MKDIPSSETLNDYYSNNYERTSYLSPITINRYNEILDRFEPFRKTGNLLDVGAGYGFGKPPVGGPVKMLVSAA
jgi:hypothetical protein